jgi:hypothetical protein
MLVTGNINFNLFGNDTKWHLISSPVEGEMYDATWIADNLIDDSTSATTNIGIAIYSNAISANGDWTYALDAANSGALTNGKGFSIKRDATGFPIIFSGTVKNDNLQNTIAIGNSGNATTENRWNLEGNPYPSHILVSDLISENASSLTNTHSTVYVWNNSENGGLGGYKALSGTDYIHPGQGFFVNANGSKNFTFDKTKLSHQTGVMLFRTSNSPSIKLNISDGEQIKSTEINYLANKTTGLDPSFDIGTFTGETSNLNVFTHLVSESNGVDFMRQALPNSDLETLVVPVGVNAERGKEITFSAEALNLPEGLKVFLEDRSKNTFTRLDEINSSYKVTLKETLNGVGRFYLYTKQSVLSVTDATSENISIYKLNEHTLRVVGLEQGNVNIKLFNVLGKQILKSSFTLNGVNNISLPELAKGIYIIKLETETGNLNKKIILE